MPILARLIKHTDEEVLTDACWALSHFTDDDGWSNQRLTALVEAGVCGRLVELLQHPSDMVQLPVLHTLGNIAGRQDRWSTGGAASRRDQLLQCGILQSLLGHLGEGCQLFILQKALRAVSKLCRGKPNFTLVGGSPLWCLQRLWSWLFEGWLY